MGLGPLCLHPARSSFRATPSTSPPRRLMLRPMDLSLSTPALLFPAISLLFLAYDSGRDASP